MDRRHGPYQSGMTFPRRFLAVPSLLLASAFLPACTSDEEKMMRFEEELAEAVSANKDDCEAMAKAITALADKKGKEAQSLKRKNVPKDGEAKAAYDAQRKSKFAARIDVVTQKVRGGSKCMLTSESVARAMLAIQGDGEDQPGRAAPEKPFTGAPVAFVVDKVSPKSLDVSAYNFADKMVGGYGLVIRYLKADGTVVPPPNAFAGRDYVTWSISGSSYRVPPGKWRSFTLDRLETPAGATRAEILVDAVRTTDGIKIDQEPIWRSSTSGWPKRP